MAGLRDRAAAILTDLQLEGTGTLMGDLRAAAASIGVEPAETVIDTLARLEAALTGTGAAPAAPAAPEAPDAMDAEPAAKTAQKTAAKSSKPSPKATKKPAATPKKRAAASKTPPKPRTKKGQAKPPVKKKPAPAAKPKKKTKPKAAAAPKAKPAAAPKPPTAPPPPPGSRVAVRFDDGEDYEGTIGDALDECSATCHFDDNTSDVIRFPDPDVRVTRVGPGAAPATVKPSAKETPRAAPTTATAPQTQPQQKCTDESPMVAVHPQTAKAQGPDAPQPRMTEAPKPNPGGNPEAAAPGMQPPVSGFRAARALDLLERLDEGARYMLDQVTPAEADAILHNLEHAGSKVENPSGYVVKAVGNVLKRRNQRLEGDGNFWGGGPPMGTRSPASAASTNSAAPAGRGRGVDNRPAWMTSGRAARAAQRRSRSLSQSPPRRRNPSRSRSLDGRGRDSSRSPPLSPTGKIIKAARQDGYAFSPKEEDNLREHHAAQARAKKTLSGTVSYLDDSIAKQRERNECAQPPRTREPPKTDVEPPASAPTRRVSEAWSPPPSRRSRSRSHGRRRRSRSPKPKKRYGSRRGRSPPPRCDNYGEDPGWCYAAATFNRRKDLPPPGVLPPGSRRANYY